MTFVKCQTPKSKISEKLLTHPWFQGVDSNSIALLEQESQFLQCETGHEIFTQGTPCHSCLLVCSGRVAGLRYTYEGSEKIFGHVRPGSFASIQSLFVQPQQHLHTIRCASEAEGILISEKAIRHLASHTPGFALHLIESGAWLIRHHTEQIDWLTSSTAEQRLCDYILRFSQAPDMQPIRLPLSWTQIATKLGIRAETVSRILAKWQKLGIIHHQRHVVKILDFNALQGILGDYQRPA